MEIGKSLSGAQSVQPKEAPRLDRIAMGIRGATERLRAHTQGFNDKADAIVGTGPQEGVGRSSGGPAAVPNGALEGIAHALDDLDDALENLAKAERRFVGLA